MPRLRLWRRRRDLGPCTTVTGGGLDGAVVPDWLIRWACLSATDGAPRVCLLSDASGGVVRCGVYRVTPDVAGGLSVVYDPVLTAAHTYGA